MFCSNCGKEIEKDAIVCPACGAEIEPKEGKRKFILILVVVIVALTLTGVGGYGIYRSIIERNAAEVARINEERERAEEAERQIKKNRAEQMAREKVREEAKTQLMEVIRKTKDGFEKYEKTEREEDLSACAKDLRKQKEQYLNLKNVEDHNLYQAGMYYLELLEDYVTLSKETRESIGEVNRFCDDLREYASIDPKNFNTLQKYVNECNKYLTGVEDEYDRISSPEFLKGWWKQMGDQLEVLEELLNRGGDSIYYEDPLRYQSFIFLDEHVAQKLLQKTSECEFIMNEVTEILNQKSKAAATVFSEMEKASVLPFEEREKYSFSKFDGKLISHCDTMEVIYPTLYNAIDQFAILEMGCISGQRDVIVEFEIPGLTQVQKQSYHVDGDLTTVFLKPPAGVGISDLSSIKSGQMRIVISDVNGNVIETHSAPVKIMSKYDFRWSNDEFGYVSTNNILCFLTPESASITKLKREAINKISSITGGKMNSFPGYQNTFGASKGKEYVNTYLQAAGVMMALSDMNVRYNMDTFSSSGGTQHILLPDDVLKYKSGLCIETSLVVASALQSADLHTYIVLPTGHAQVAVETWAGSGDYFLIETTCLPNSSSMIVEYVNSLMKGNISGNKGLDYVHSGYPIAWLSDKAWEQYVKDQSVVFIDCSDSSLLGATPFSR